MAKTYGAQDDSRLPGRNVIEHALITGTVAQALISLFPQDLREFFFPDGCGRLVGAHDIGKVSPTFQKRVYSAIGAVPPQLATVNDPELEKQWGYHAGTGRATLDACNLGNYLADIVGRHHGSLCVKRMLSTADLLGGQAWHDRRLELLEVLQTYFPGPWPQIASQTRADVLAGLTTVADWIGSGPLFDDPAIAWQGSIEQAVQNAGFIKPEILPKLSFAEIFGNQPYPAQEAFYTACNGPGVYLLEAPMGHGKTEAALFAAYKLLSANLATGLYFALPTRLTSDKIHQRVQGFLQKILVPGSAHRQALLLHGNAHLRNMELGEDGAPGGEWFNSLKRAVLAPFGVGTLDQALLAVLPDIRHNFIRSFGLLGKVVILDEVHSYDGYTGLLLDSLIEQLRELHCTVIILSATLTRERRSVMLRTTVDHQGYPLISAMSLADPALQEMTIEPLSDSTVSLLPCAVEQDALLEALERAEQGQQVLWIENTVAEAQASYAKLRARAGDDLECGLLHSRFLAADRERLEQHWINCYGKSGPTRCQSGRILVGTQVLEQSLDIDADFLVTRLCPTDMFLQRLGRLWRHERANRASSAMREAWLLIPPQSVPLSAEDLGKSGKVYDPYLLLRSLEVLQSLTTVHLPSDIRPLLESTYAERAENGPLAILKNKLLEKTTKLARQARLAQAALGQARTENIATRYSEIDSTPVLLLRKLRFEKTGMHLQFVDGSEAFFPRNIKVYDKPGWRELALLLAANLVSVASYQAPQCKIPDQHKKYFKDFMWFGQDEDSRLRIAVVGGSNELRSIDKGAVSERYELEYTSHLGYMARKK